MRPTWSGMITFGLVNVPVDLYVAVKEEVHHMNYLRKDDLCPIQYKKVCRVTGEEVPYKDIVKGYEYKDGDFVVLSDEDFKKADVKKTGTIDVEVFVDETDVDPKYMEKPYYLAPQKKAHKTFALFREAMAKSQKAAVGKFVLRDREHLVLLKAEGKVHPPDHAPLRRHAPGSRRARPAGEERDSQGAIGPRPGAHQEVRRSLQAGGVQGHLRRPAQGDHRRPEEGQDRPRPGRGGAAETEIEDIMSKLKESLHLETRH